MPFTFSHPAITLPLTYLPKRFWSLTGLIAGSVAPDFEYFIRFRPEGHYSHTIDGMFWFDLPMALSLAFIFHLVVRDPLISSLPGWFSRRLNCYSGFDWKNDFVKRWPVVLLSLLIGIFSHLFWDAFTHGTGWFVTHFLFLQTNFRIVGYDVPLYHILQHSNSVLGALVILYAIRKLPENAGSGKFDLRYWGIAVLTMLVVIGMGALLGKDYWVYGELIVTGISGGLIGILVAGIDKRYRV